MAVEVISKLVQDYFVLVLQALLVKVVEVLFHIGHTVYDIVLLGDDLANRLFVKSERCDHLLGLDEGSDGEDEALDCKFRN